MPRRSVSRTVFDKQVLPRLGHPPDRSLGDANVHLQEDQVAETRRLHGFQVGGHLLAIEIAVHEIPVNPGPRGVRRIEEIIFQLVRSQDTAAKRTGKQRHKYILKHIRKARDNVS